ncbi:MAG TPA: transglutaminase family protein [Xanthobacteraceae bacterium]|jgi:transglutaminase-like putative cysteine protease|nr:transglutaminase family protein [Xanthobacteraceae bacterium]
MRLSISHKTTYNYTPPAARVIQMLRLTPRNHDGQYVADWRIEASADCRLDQHEDAFGNITHSFAADGPLSALSLLVEGEIETRDVNGVMRDTAERFPPSLFLRETTLTACDDAIAAFAVSAQGAHGGETLVVLHGLLEGVHKAMVWDDHRPYEGTPAAEAFALKHGIAPDFAHVFITAARSLGIPARFVAGYFCGDPTNKRDAGHAWAEAFVGDLGWVAFDPANGICATDAHARVAVGLDHLGAAPVRGMRYGGGAETLTVDIHIDQASRQTQS